MYANFGADGYVHLRWICDYLWNHLNNQVRLFGKIQSIFWIDKSDHLEQVGPSGNDRS